jgi:hypothetical protein
MPERTVEDRLRDEYFRLLPDARRVAEELEARVRHCLLPISLELDNYERLVVTSRIKDCESAVEALRRRREGATFDPDRSDSYTLTALPDLAGVRVLCFPRNRWIEANDLLRKEFSSWTSDPVTAGGASFETIAFKYHGYCEVSTKIRGELQLVPMLIGLFWQVEHSAIYKPSPQLKGVLLKLEMQQRTSAVLQALEAFEDEFEKALRTNDPLGRSSAVNANETQ